MGCFCQLAPRDLHYTFLLFSFVVCVVALSRGRAQRDAVTAGGITESEPLLSSAAPRDVQIASVAFSMATGGALQSSGAAPRNKYTPDGATASETIVSMSWCGEGANADQDAMTTVSITEGAPQLSSAAHRDPDFSTTSTGALQPSSAAPLSAPLNDFTRADAMASETVASMSWCGEGTNVRALADLEIFLDPASGVRRGTASVGEVLVAAGPPVHVDDCATLPLLPWGAVRLRPSGALEKYVGPELNLTLRGLNGDILAAVRVPVDTTPAQLKDMLSARARLHIARELLQIIAPSGTRLLSRITALVDLGVRDGDSVTCLALQVPPGYDTVGWCDGCDDCRHLFYGYSFSRGAPEVVIALCEACGGTPYNPCSGDSEVTTDGGDGADDDDDDDGHDGSDAPVGERARYMIQTIVL